MFSDDYHIFSRMMDKSSGRNAVLRGSAIRKAACCVLAFFLLSIPVFAYEAVLKNGKVVKGDLVSQAEDKAMPEEAKKRARVYTQEDIERLRRQTDLGEGSFSKEANLTEKRKTPEELAKEKKAAAEAQRRHEKADFLKKRIEEAKDVYDTMSPQCEFLKTTFIQRWQIKDQQGRILPYYDTIKKTCDEADKAKNLIEKCTKELSRLQ